MTGFNATAPGAAIMGLANTALDALSNGSAARVADKVARAGAATQAFGGQLQAG